MPLCDHRPSSIKAHHSHLPNLYTENSLCLPPSAVAFHLNFIIIFIFLFSFFPLSTPLNREQSLPSYKSITDQAGRLQSSLCSPLPSAVAHLPPLHRLCNSPKIESKATTNMGPLGSDRVAQILSDFVSVLCS